MPQEQKTREYLANEYGVFTPASAAKFNYSDGVGEEEYLLKFLSACADKRTLSPELMQSKQDWATLYHLSQRRANLLRPVESLIKGKDILEIGSGCGALTRYLGETARHVTAVEGSPIRARIGALRCDDLDNVTIYADTIQSFNLNKKFDIVTVIGVLEYARLYDSCPCPELNLLRIARSFLKPNGFLILAIENKLGLKYFAGVPEDHVGRPFYGINNCYSDKTVVTFGRRDLETLLRRLGFTSIHQYVPLPDYKLPVTVIHPSGLDASEPSINVGQFALDSIVYDPQAQLCPIFSLEASCQEISSNGLLKDLCNSFLYIASMSDTQTVIDSSVLASHYGIARLEPFAKEAIFKRTGDTITIHRRRLSPNAMSNQLVIDFPDVETYVDYVPYQDELLRIVNKPGWTVFAVSRWAAPWVAFLLSLASGEGDDRVLPSNALDMVPNNFMMSPKGKLIAFDAEWLYADNRPVRLDYLLVSGLLGGMGRINSVARPDSQVPIKVCSLVISILKAHDICVSEARLVEILVELVLFRTQVTGDRRKPPELMQAILKSELRVRVLG